MKVKDLIKLLQQEDLEAWIEIYNLDNDENVKRGDILVVKKIGEIGD